MRKKEVRTGLWHDGSTGRMVCHMLICAMDSGSRYSKIDVVGGTGRVSRFTETKCLTNMILDGRIANDRT